MGNTFLNVSIFMLLASCEGCKTDEPKPKTEFEKIPPARPDAFFARHEGIFHITSTL
jgi:hypothetical protein